MPYKKNNPGCPCCDCCDCGTATGCPTCGSTAYMKSRWAFTMTGVANSSCSTCATYNGSYQLCYVSGCTFNTPTACYGSVSCSTVTNPKYSLTKAGGAAATCRDSLEWNLRASGGNGACNPPYPNSLEKYWALEPASWSCSSSNTMTDTSCCVGNHCSSWPSSVVLAPCS